MQVVPNALTREQLPHDPEQAYNAMFEAYWQSSFAAAYRVLRDKEAAEDVVQEVFLDLWARRESLLMHNPAAFIRQMVKNQVFTYLSRRKLSKHNEAVLENLLLASSPEEEYLHTELATRLQDAVDKLPKRCQEVFLLRRQEGLSAVHIAERLDISIRTVENHLYHALNLLKKQLHLVMLLLLINEVF
jgi:RNA polymerase sigma-70 factor (family 1)